MSYSKKYNRSEGTISLTQMGVPSNKIGEVAAMLIGRRGSGIKRYTKAAAGSFIKLFNGEKGKDAKAAVADCDTVYISARSDEDVRKVASMITQDIQAFFDPSVKSTRPSLEVDCPTDAVGTVIGKRGENLKRLMRHIGEGCYVIHNSATGKFEVTADNKNACLRTEQKIKDAIHDFYEDQKQYKRNRRRGTSAPQGEDTKSSNSFAAFEASDSDEDSDGELDEDEVRLIAQKKRDKMAQDLKAQMFSNGSSIDSIKRDERYRWEVRHDLAKMDDPETGGPLFPDYTARVGGRTRKFTGVHAVPWAEVDNEIQRRKEIGKRQADERESRKRGLREHRARKEVSTASFPQMDGFNTSVQPVKSSGWGDLSKVKDSAGVAEIRQKSTSRGPRPTRSAVPSSAPTPVRDYSNMVTLTPSQVISQVAFDDTYVGPSEPVDLTPNVTLTVEEKKPVEPIPPLTKITCWADECSSDEEDEVDQFGRPIEDNSAWD